jgi:hypothetical protein
VVQGEGPEFKPKYLKKKSLELFEGMIIEKEIKYAYLHYRQYLRMGYINTFYCYSTWAYSAE